MERILLLGASGLLGTEVLRTLQNEKFDFVAPKSVDLDIRKRNLVNEFLHEFKPTWIINCAAWTNVDAAEDSFEKACELNEAAVGNICIGAQVIGCKVIVLFESLPVSWQQFD